MTTVQPTPDSVPASLETADQIARRLTVPVSWVYHAAREGLIPCVRLGRYVRFDPDVVLAEIKKIRNG